MVDREHGGGHLGPIHGGKGVAHVAVAARGEDPAPAGDDLERHARVGEGIVRCQHYHGSRFGGGTAEEFPARRHPGEEVADRHAGAHRGGARKPADRAAFNQRQEDRDRFVTRPADHFHVGGGSNRGERLAAESERVDLEQVIERRDL